jgi:hypothetical protein
MDFLAIYRKARNGCGEAVSLCNDRRILYYNEGGYAKPVSAKAFPC